MITVNDVAVEFGGTTLFSEVTFAINETDKIALMGKNGAGKSTLLKMIMGKEKSEDGQIELGKHNVIPGYFEQNEAEALNLSKQVIETIHDEVPDWTNQEVRTILGRFLFTGETVFKPVGALSGGEKARLALAKMLLSPCNLLILDEPTNHLDIPAKEMLEEAIQDYDGTAILVSHDRYFISKVANKIVEIRNGELVVYAGDYHYYLDKLEEEKEKEKLRQEEAKKAAKKAQKKASSKK